MGRLESVLQAVGPAYRATFPDAYAPETARKVVATERLLARIDPGFAWPGRRVLDLGCGMGRLLAMLGALGAGPLWGLDDFGDGGSVDDQTARLRALGATPLVHDVARRPWPVASSSLDLVVSFNMLEHLHHGPRPLLFEARRVLRPGGVCVLGVPNAVALYKRLYVLAGRTNYPRFDVWWRADEWREHVRETAPGELRASLARAGFRATEEIGLDMELPERLGRAYPLYRAAVALAPAQFGESLFCAGVNPA